MENAIASPELEVELILSNQWYTWFNTPTKVNQPLPVRFKTRVGL